MLRASLYQQSLLEVDPDEIALPLGSFERQLRDLVPRLFSVNDFHELHPSTEGAPTCCPLVLVAMLLLQFRFDVSDRLLVERCTRDLGWRYAIGLKRGDLPPSTTTIVRFRSALRQLKGDSFVLDRVLEHARKQGLIDDVALQAIDSTNTDCRGAIIDTFNLVATAIGLVVRRVAAALGEDARGLAARWNLSRYLARSVKGAAAIDWSDEGQRNKLLTEEIADADRVKSGKEVQVPSRPPGRSVPGMASGGAANFHPWAPPAALGRPRDSDGSSMRQQRTAMRMAHLSRGTCASVGAPWALVTRWGRGGPPRTAAPQRTAAGATGAGRGAGRPGSFSPCPTP